MWDPNSQMHDYLYGVPRTVKGVDGTAVSKEEEERLSHDLMHTVFSTRILQMDHGDGNPTTRMYLMLVTHVLTMLHG